MNTMIYCGNLDDVQTYFMNYVVASKSVLVVYGAISISTFKRLLVVYGAISISEVGQHLILEPKWDTDCLLSLHRNHACLGSGSNQRRLQRPFLSQP